MSENENEKEEQGLQEPKSPIEKSLHSERKSSTGSHGEDPRFESVQEVNLGSKTNEEEIVVSIEDEQVAIDDPDAGPNWVKDLRHRYKEVMRKNKELEAQLAGKGSTETYSDIADSSVPHPGEKPQLEDVDYELEKYQAVYADWYEKKRRYDDHQKTAQARAEADQQSWSESLAAYQRKKAELSLKDFDLAEEAFVSRFSKIHQGVVVKACNNPALVVYVLGKNKEKANELARHKDPLKFAFALADFEKNLKVTRKPATQAKAEEKLTGADSSYRESDKDIESLIEEAQRTGDATKYLRARSARKRNARKAE